MVHHRPSGRGSVVKVATTVIGQKMRYSSERIWSVNVTAVNNLRKPLCGAVAVNRIKYDAIVAVTAQHRVVSLPPASSQRFFSGGLGRKEDEINTTPSLSFFQRIVSVVRTTLTSFTPSDVVTEQPAVTTVPTNAAKDSASSIRGDATTAKIEPTEIPLNNFVIKDGAFQLEKTTSESVKRSQSMKRTAAADSVAKSIADSDDSSSQRKMEFIRSKMAPLLHGSHVATAQKIVIPGTPTTMVVPKVDPPLIVIPVANTSTVVAPNVAPLNVPKPREKQHPDSASTINLSDTISNLISNQNAPVAPTLVSPKVSPLNVPKPREKQHLDPASTINLSDTISNLISRQNAPAVPLPLREPLKTTKPARGNQRNGVSADLSNRLRSDFPVIPEMPFHLPEVNWQQPPKQPKTTHVKSWKAQRIRKQQQRNGQNEQVKQQGITPQESVSTFATPMPNTQNLASSNQPPLQSNRSRGSGVRRNTPQTLDPKAIHLLRSQLVEQVKNSQANAIQKQMSSNTHSASSADGLNLTAVGQNPAVDVFRHRPTGKLDIFDRIRSRFPTKPSGPAPKVLLNPMNAQSEPNPLNSIFSGQQGQSFEHQFAPSRNAQNSMVSPIPIAKHSAAVSDNVFANGKDNDHLAQMKSQLSESELSSPLTTNITTAASINDVNFDRRNPKYMDAMERIRSRLSHVTPFDVEPNISSVPIFEPIPIQPSDASEPLPASPKNHSSDNSVIAKSHPFDHNTKLSDLSQLQQKLQHLKSSYTPSYESIISSSNSSTTSAFDVASGPSHDNDFIAKLRSRLIAQQTPQEQVVGLPSFPPDGDTTTAKDTSSPMYVHAMERMRSKLPKVKVNEGMEQQSHPQESLQAISTEIHKTTSDTPRHKQPGHHDDQNALDSQSVSDDIATSISYGNDAVRSPFNSEPPQDMSSNVNLSNAVDSSGNDVNPSVYQQSLSPPSRSLNDSLIDSAHGEASHSFDADAFTRLKSRLLSHQEPQNVDDPRPVVDALRTSLNDSTAASNSSLRMNLLDAIRSKYAISDLKEDMGQVRSSTYNDGDTSETMNYQRHAQESGSINSNLFDSAGIEASHSTDDEAFARLKSRLPVHTDPQPIHQGEQESQNNSNVKAAPSSALESQNEAQNNYDTTAALSDTLRRSNIIDRLRSQLPKGNLGLEVQERSSASSDMNFSYANQTSIASISKEENLQQSNGSFPPSSANDNDEMLLKVARNHDDQTTERVSIEPLIRPVPNVLHPNFENSGQSEHLPFSNGRSTGSEAAKDVDVVDKLRAIVDNSCQQKEPLKQTLSGQLIDETNWRRTNADSNNSSELDSLLARLPNWGQQAVSTLNATTLDSRSSIQLNNDRSNDEAITKLQARLGLTDATVDGTSVDGSRIEVGFENNIAFQNLKHVGPNDDAIAKLQSRLGRTDPFVDNTAQSHFEPLLHLQSTGSMETALGDDTLRNLQKRLGQEDSPVAPFVADVSWNARSKIDEQTTENSNQRLHLDSSTLSDSAAPVFPSNVDVMDVMPSRQNNKHSSTTAGVYSSMSHNVKAPSAKSKDWKNQFVQQKKVKKNVKEQKSRGGGQRKDILDRISVGLSELIPLAKPQVAAESRAPIIEPKAVSALESLRHKFLVAKESDASARSTHPGASSMNQWSLRGKNLLQTSEHLPHLPNPSHTLDRIFDVGSTRPLIQPQRERALQHQRSRFPDQSSSSTGKQYDGTFSSPSSDKPPLIEIIRNMQYHNSLMFRSEGADGQSRDNSASFDSQHPSVVPKWRQSGNDREQHPGSTSNFSSPPPPPEPRKPVFIHPKKQAIALPSFQISLAEASQLFREKTSRLLEVLESLGEVRPEGIGEEDHESWMLSKETLELMAMEIGQLVEESSAATPSLSDEELLLMRRAAADATPLAVSQEEPDYKSFPTRPPVVCIMGHVDHGKTTLMDALRRRAAKESSADAKKSKGKDKKKDKGKKDKGKKAGDKSGDVAGTEAGGITQVISAFEVPLIEQENATSSVTFLDTPGHAAFTAMRQSGSDAADIIVLVIAADDGVSEQTVEILNFYKSIVKGAGSGGISLVVAMNKIDKPGIDVEEATRRIQGQLLEHGILTEGMPSSEGMTEYGPAVQMVPVSGLTGLGLDDLIEGLVLQSEMMDLRAPTDAGAEGIVMDARIDKGVGIVVDCIVRWGSLQKGDIVVSGTKKGKVRLLKDVKNAALPQGLPSQPVRIIGFDSLPKAGDPFVCVASEEAADELVSRRMAAEGVSDAAPTPVRLSDSELQSAGRHMMTHAWKDALETKYGLQSDGEAAGPTRIPVVIKADADGTLAAVRDALVQLGIQSAQNVVIEPIKVGVGPLLPSEIQMAQECQASIVCFNIKNDSHLVLLAEENQVRILQSDIIYTLLDEAKLVLARHLPDVPVEIVQGRGQVLASFDIGGLEDRVAGLKVLEGSLFKDQTVATKGVPSAPCQYRVLRNGVPVATGLTASSLKHFKDDVTEVLRGKECGISLAGYQDYEVGDEVECYAVELRPATL